MRSCRALPMVLALWLIGPALPAAQEAPLVAGSEGVPLPKRTRFVMPVYPPDALAQGLRGIVILDLVIDEQGHVEDVSIIRSIPGLDEAAVAAARRWEYEPVKVGGRPVKIRLTVPITFALKLPEVSRQAGIPELRQGVTPRGPKGTTSGGRAVAEVTLDPDGRVGIARVIEGEEPWSTALLQALRTWRFATPPDDVSLSFRVAADFGAGRGDEGQRVTLRLEGLQESSLLAPPVAAADTHAGASPASANGEAEHGQAAPAGEASAPGEAPEAAENTAPAAGTEGQHAGAEAPARVAQAQTAPPPAGAASAAVPQPEAEAASPASSQGGTAAGEPSSGSGVAAAPSAPSSQSGPAPAGAAAGAPAPAEGAAPPAAAAPASAASPPGSAPAPASPGPAPAPAAPSATEAGASDLAPTAPPPPPVEVLTASPPPLPPENGISAIRGVTLEPGVPDLTQGRRPVAPPVARMAGASGEVQVDFSVGAGGVTTVQEVRGPQILQAAARAAVETWTFRRTRAERLYLTAAFTYQDDAASADVRPQTLP